MATPSLTKKVLHGVLVRKPTEDDLVVAAAGFGTLGTLSRRSPLLQVMSKDIADSDRFVGGIGGGRIVPFKDTRCVFAVPPHGAAEAPSCDCRARTSRRHRRPGI
jgi:hypothetical protein